jgi:hypothetical protein
MSNYGPCRCTCHYKGWAHNNAIQCAREVRPLAGHKISYRARPMAQPLTNYLWEVLHGLEDIIERVEREIRKP